MLSSGRIEYTECNAEHPLAVRDLGCDHKLVECWIFLTRFVITRRRAATRVVVDFVLVAVGAAVIGLIVGPDLDGKNLAKKELLLNNLMTSLIYGTLSCVASLAVFGEGRLMFWREASENASIMGFFCARVAVDSVLIVLRTLLFTVVVYDLTLPMTPPQDIFVMFLCLAFAQSGWGYLLSIIVHPSSRTLYAALLSVLLGAFFSGVLPEMRPWRIEMATTLKGAPTPMYAITHISYARFSVESLVVSEVNHSPAGQTRYDQAGLLQAAAMGVLDKVLNDGHKDLRAPLESYRGKGVDLLPDPNARVVGQSYLTLCLYPVLLGTVLRALTLLALYSTHRAQMNKTPCGALILWGCGRCLHCKCGRCRKKKITKTDDRQSSEDEEDDDGIARRSSIQSNDVLSFGPSFINR